MGFWDSFRKATAVTAGVGAVAGAITAGVSSSLKNSFNRKMKQQELNLKNQQQLLDQEIKLKELELKQRKIDTDYARDIQLNQMNNQTDLSKSQIDYMRDIQLNQMNNQTDLSKIQMNNQTDLTKMQMSNQADLTKTEMNNMKDITLAQTQAQKECNLQNMRSQQAVQTTALYSQANVEKARAMYNPDSPLGKNGGYMCDANEGVTVDGRNVVYNNTNVPGYGYVAQPYNMNMGMMGMGAHNPQMLANNSNMNMNQIQERILQAKQLLDQGIISEQEFTNIKKEILNHSF